MSKESDLTRVNYERVLSSPQTSALAKLTVMKLQKQQYLTLAEFMKGLSDTDLQALVQQFDKLDNVYILQDIVLLAEIVAGGEGDSTFDVDDIELRTDNLRYFISMVTCESLQRKGFVDIDYTKVTFDPAYRNKEVVKARK